MRRMKHLATALRSSSPAQAGDPVRRGLSIPSLPSLEYWITRLREGFAEVAELAG